MLSLRATDFTPALSLPRLEVRRASRRDSCASSASAWALRRPPVSSACISSSAQGLHTRCSSSGSTSTSRKVLALVQALQMTPPQLRQWCLRATPNRENFLSQSLLVEMERNAIMRWQ